MTILNILIAVLGLGLAVAGPWFPRLISHLEAFLLRQVSDTQAYRAALEKEFKVLAPLAKSAVEEAAKGPQLQAPEEAWASMLVSLGNIRAFISFYAAGAFLAVILNPLSAIVASMRKIGRGGVVSGIGIVVAIIGLLLALSPASSEIARTP